MQPCGYVYQKDLPFCLREVWVITACLALVKATSQRFTVLAVTPDVAKDFYRLQGDLYSYARTKVLLLSALSWCYCVGYLSAQTHVCGTSDEVISYLKLLRGVTWKCQIQCWKTRRLICTVEVLRALLLISFSQLLQLMRLADLIGYGHNIETSPCNRYCNWFFI